MLKSGIINLSAGNEKIFQLTAQANQLDVNIIEKKFLKELLKDNTNTSSFRELIKQLKTLAQELKNEKITITVSYKSAKVVTLGSDAKPNFSQLITRTSEIEINNLRKLIQLGIL